MGWFTRESNFMDREPFMWRGLIPDGGIRVGGKYLVHPLPSMGPVDANVVEGIRNREMPFGYDGWIIYKASEIARPNLQIDEFGTCTISTINPDTGGHNPDLVLRMDDLNPNDAKKHDFQEKTLDNLFLVAVSATQFPIYRFWQEPSARPEPRVQKTVAQLIDESFAEHTRLEAEKLAHDPNQMLRMLPSITPADPRWAQALIKFEELTQKCKENKSQSIDSFLRSQFTDSQRLMLMPATHHGARMDMQDSHAKLYADARNTIFRGCHDNLVTKLTMLHFGLPIAPITSQNIQNMGKNTEDDPPDSPLEGDFIQRIRFGEPPLDFLDYYQERHYGYIGARHKPVGPLIDLRTLDMQTRVALEKRTLKPRRCGTGMNRRRWQSTLSLRGGDGGPARNPSDRIAIWSNIGFLWAYTDKDDFQRVALKSLDMVPGDAWAFHVEYYHKTYGPSFELQINRVSPMTGRQNYYIHHCKNPQAFPSEKALNLFDDRKWRAILTAASREADTIVRVRSWWPEVEPAVTSLKNHAEIYWERAGKVCWKVLPSGEDRADSDDSRKFHEHTFRTAIEYLISEHEQCTIEFILPSGQKGRWKMRDGFSTSGFDSEIVEAVKQHGGDSLVRLTITKVDRDESEHQMVRILIPGHSHWSSYPALSAEYYPRRLMEVIRTAVMKTTSGEFQSIRVWPTYDDYRTGYKDKDSYWTLNENKAEIFVTRSKIVDRKAIVARPIFNGCYLWKNKQAENARMVSAGSNEPTFEQVLKHLAELFDSAAEKRQIDFKDRDSQNKNFFTLSQPHSSRKFVMSPRCSEEYWRLEVFDKLQSENIIVTIGVPLHVSNWPTSDTGPLAEDDPSTTQRPRPWKLSEVNLPAPQNLSMKNLASSSRPSFGQRTPDGWKGKEVDTGSLRPWTFRGSIENTPDTDAGSQSEGPHEGGEVPHPPGPRRGDRGPVGGSQTTRPSGAPQPHGPHGGGRKNPNKRTHIHPKTVPPPSVEWVKYQEDQFKEADLKYEAYTRSRSVNEEIDEDDLPVISKHGQAFETQYSGGPLFPTVFQAPMSPNEIAELKQRCRHLENVILDRLRFCPVCPAELKPGPLHNKEAKEHFEGHMNRQKEMGRCPLCNHSHWLIWTPTQRAGHIRAHASSNKTWEHRCFVGDCDTPIGKGPSVSAAKLDINDHYRMHLAKEKASFFTSYCPHCSKNLKKLSSLAEADDHVANCPDLFSSAGHPRFCNICGHSIVTLDRVQYDEHRQKCINNQRNILIYHTTEEMCEFCRINLRDTKIFPTIQDVINHVENHKPPTRSAADQLCDIQGCEARLSDVKRFPTLLSIYKHALEHLASKLPELCGVDGCIVDLADRKIFPSIHDKIHHYNSHNKAADTPPGEPSGNTLLPFLTNEWKESNSESFSAAQKKLRRWYCPACWEDVGDLDEQGLQPHRTECKVDEEAWKFYTATEHAGHVRNVPWDKIKTPKKSPKGKNKAEGQLGGSSGKKPRMAG